MALIQARQAVRTPLPISVNHCLGKRDFTITLTQWFVLLRSKNWGKFVIVPIIILGVLLVIPLGLIAILVLIIRSIFSSRRY